MQFDSPLPVLEFGEVVRGEAASDLIDGKIVMLGISPALGGATFFTEKDPRMPATLFVAHATQTLINQVGTKPLGLAKRIRSRADRWGEVLDSTNPLQTVRIFRHYGVSLPFTSGQGLTLRIHPTKTRLRLEVGPNLDLTSSVPDTCLGDTHQT